MRQHYLLVCLFLLPFVGRANPGYGSIEFVPNKGQWDEPFLYKSKTNTGNVFLEKNGFTFLVGAPENADKVLKYKTGMLEDNAVLRFHAYKIIIENANLSAEVTGLKPQKHYYNYFLGNDKNRWKTGIHPNYAVDYTDIYNGIDLHISSEKGDLKYDFIVRPGAYANTISLHYEGTDGLSVQDGKLMIHTSVGTVEELAPTAYQYINGERKAVACRYNVKNEIVTYSFPKGYDETQTLIIDPTVVFSRLTGSSYDNWGFTATYDIQGNFYAGGITSDLYGGTGYPTTTGAFQTVYKKGRPATIFPCDMAITKFDPTGVNMIYSTYLGGNGNDQPHSLVVDPSGDLIIAGRSDSTGYPVSGYQNNNAGGIDIVVTKLNAAGTALIGSTYIGGTGNDGVNFRPEEDSIGHLKFNYGDDARSEVIVDNSGNIYVAGSTQSSDFPLANAFQNALKGAQDGVVFKLNSNLSSLLWSTYLGGSQDDAAYVLALNSTNNYLYVAGGTSSANFPTTAGTFQPAYAGGLADGFIARFVNSGSYTPDKVTFMGRSNYDQCYGLQVDLEDNVYTMGQTLGGTFPVKIAPTASSIYSNPNSSQFIIKLDPALTTNIYSTVFGSQNPNNVNISPVAFLVDTCQNVYISGWGGTLNIANNGATTTGLPVTPASITAPLQSTTDGNDFYFMALSKNALQLSFGAFFGRNDPNPQKGEHVDGGTSRFDKDGIIYQAICGGCGDPIGSTSFPTTVGPAKGSSNCNLAALKIAFNLGAVKAKAEVQPDGVVCLGESIQLQNLSANAISYEWDFADGTPINTAQTPPPHTYTSVGKYKVRLIVINPNVCKVRDTDYVNITVDTVKIKANFTATVTDNCKPYKIQITNNSSYSKTPGAQSFTKFIWDFGDGKTATGTNPGHEYADTGTYTITLTMIDTTACNSPDTIHKTVHFSNIYVKAGFILSDLCEKNDIDFPNSSQNATTYLWNFGDGDTSTAATPSHRYDTTGSYKVTLIAYNSASCNKTDTMSLTVNVKDSPIADFDFTPKNSVDTNERNNKPYYFTNLSQRAEVYRWNFGDNTGSEDKTPTPHYYKKRGNYTVCLAAKNSLDCWDTVCKKIDAIVYPLVDLPTAFTPNGDGNNDVFYVRGGGIDKVTLKIYNRWGQKVFEATDVDANDPTRGWDGTYQGKQQEMDAYAFIMSGYFIDGTTFYKKGNVTLIR